MYIQSASRSNLDNSISYNGRRLEAIMSQANTPLIDFIHQWLLETKYLEVKPNTYSRLEQSARTLSHYPISNIPLCEIAPTDFSAYIRQLTADGYARTGIKKLMEIVSAPLRYACAQQIITFNPCQGAKLPAKVHVKKAQKMPDAFTPEQQATLRAYWAEHSNIDAYRACELMLETGMRAGECLSFRWDDVDLQRHRLYVHRTLVNPNNREKAYIQDSAKSEASNRYVPLSPRAEAILREQCRISASRQDVWVNQRGETLTYQALQIQHKKGCRLAGVPYLSLHGLRHTFATNQFYKGTNVKILSRLMGHANPTVTYNTYIHLFGDGFAEMLEAVCK